MLYHLNLKDGGYDVICQRGLLADIGNLLPLQRRVLIVTDNGVPSQYADAVAAASLSPVIVTLQQGESSKNLKEFEHLCRVMLENGFTRGDCVVAVGGGVMGDLACFAAASYMRGIDFYNIPTTVLSAVDSSVGGKCGVDFCGVKNILGAFYQPKRVIIDPDVLKTLPPRQIANGLAEVLKMALTFDKELFMKLECAPIDDTLIEEVIFRSVMLKGNIVEQDEREGNVRKSLNFGHTFGHAIEAAEGLHGLYHGECVALGMLPVCGDKIWQRVRAVEKKLSLPVSLSVPVSEILPYCAHDKKFRNGKVDAVFVEDIGSYEIRSMTIDEWQTLIVKNSYRLSE